MKEKTTENALADILILVIFGASHFFVILLSIAFFYSFLDCCGEGCLEPYSSFSDGIRFPIVFAIFHLIIVFFICKSRAVIFIFSVFVVVSTTFITLDFKANLPNFANYYEEFDAQKWKKEKPIEMVRVFFEDERFIGKTSLELIETLGEGYEMRYNRIDYYIRNAYATTLVFTLENDTVVNQELYCYD